jgi:sec-independent protein translocase protein TatB
MFGFGHGPELIIILVIALIVLGPGKIPEIAQMLGKGLRELRQASADLQKTFDVNELMNPAPPPPASPPVEAAPVAATETIAPPELVAKPKRTRKPRAAGVPTPAEAAGVGWAEGTPGDDHPHTDLLPPADEGTAVGDKPRPRRRPSKKAAEPVSLDAPA